MQNNDGTMNAGREWVAWPPGGAFPLQAYQMSRMSLSQTGWSIQSERLDLSEPEVVVTSDGAELPVAVEALEGNYGASEGIRIVPDGWDVAAGSSYEVVASFAGGDVAYAFEIVDCGE
jgi:hypothetical protein